jgi:hypothetical protein
MTLPEMAQAKFSQAGNDMYWSLDADQDGTINWEGSDAANWWDNVSIYEHSRTRVGAVTGRTFSLDFDSGEVTISPAVSL